MEQVAPQITWKRRHRMTRYKVGREVRWGLKADGFVEPTTLSKKEQAYVDKTGWPFRLPDRYMGPDWPERLYK